MNDDQYKTILEKRLSVSQLNEWASRTVFSYRTTGFSGIQGISQAWRCSTLQRKISDPVSSEHGIEYETLAWPGNSLDVNRVEKLWGYLQVRNENENHASFLFHW